MARAKISELSCFHINTILLQGSDITVETKFLIFRLIFIVTIDFDGCKFLKEDCLQVEPVISDVFSSLNDSIVDESDMGRIVIDILRYRYNLIKHQLIDHKRCVKETLEGVLRTIKIESRTIDLAGSSLNVFLGSGSESTEIGDMKSLEIEKCLKLIADAYVETNNKDYVSTVLMVALKVVENEQCRKDLRNSFLPTNDKKFLGVWKKMLLSTDTNISFLTGEFLLKLCKERVSRLNRHLGFESTAGYLYSKGLLKGNARQGVDCEIEELGSSSDEDYFLNHSPEPVEHTHIYPENEEESKELEYLMKRISDYNERFQN